MTNLAVFACTIGTTNGTVPLGLEIWLDDQAIYTTDHLRETQQFHYEFSDTAGDHELRFVMKNKTIQHTEIDQQGGIVRDAGIVISDVAFAGIALGHTLVEQAQYQHDFNGTQSAVTVPFYGEMGCNGTVSLEFTTPIYLWLLEHTH